MSRAHSRKIARWPVQSGDGLPRRGKRFPCHSLIFFWAGLSLLMGCGLHAAEIHFFKEARELTVKPGRFAVYSDPSAPASDLDVQALGLDSLPVSGPIAGWSFVADAGQITSVQTLDRARALSSEAQGRFVSPVFQDDLGGDLYIAPQLIVQFAPAVSEANAQGYLSRYAAGEVLASNWKGLENTYLCRPQTLDALEVLDIANTLARLPQVLFAEPNMIFSGTVGFLPDDPGFSEVWGVHNTGQDGGTADMDMDGPEAWDITTGSPDILVGILDSGIDQTHPDLRQMPGADFTTYGPSDGEPVSVYDKHGTTVAGCVSAIASNALGTVGIAPGCRSVSLRIFTVINNAGNWTGETSWTVDALDWAETHGLRVSNNSSSYGYYSSAIAAKYAATRANGMVHFSSAGNSSSSVIGFPASLPDVNAVASLTRDGTLSSFSNYGTGLAFSAPGSSIYTTDQQGSAGYSSGDYATVNGTSFSSPYAAGVAALILSQQPALTAAEVEQIMQVSAFDLGTAGYDTRYGYGFLNAEAALLLCSEFPEIMVQGNGVEIFNGSSSFSTANYTDFGAVKTGQSQTNSYQVINTGGTNLLLNGSPTVAVAGTHPSDFSVSLSPATNLPPSGVVEFGVVFTPTAEGIRECEIRIENNDNNENPYLFLLRGTGSTNDLPEIGIWGNGLEILDGSWTPSVDNGTDFGSVLVTGSVSRLFTITNSGSASLELTQTPSVSLLGILSNDFLVSQVPDPSIPVGGSTQFEIQFTPKGEGLRSVQVTVHNSDPNEDPYSFRIQGNATPLPRSEMSIGFAGQPVLSTWVQDKETSRMIDMGDPNRPVANEPNPNGGVVNMGVYGNTSFASLSSTNPWIYALTASTGGRLEGSFDLVWAYGNIDSTHTVHLEYSYDNGVTWTSIASSVSITNRSILWESAQLQGQVDRYPSSPIARWQITVESQTNWTDRTDEFFALRNHPFRYYLNDASTNQDVYTSAVGNDLNLGFFPSAPKATLANLLSEIDVEGSDTIIFDTGQYLFSKDETIPSSDGGAAGNPAVILGSPNGPGSQLIGSGVALSNYASHVILSNLFFVGLDLSVVGSDVLMDRLEFQTADVRLNGTGHVFQASQLLAGNLTVPGDEMLIQQVEVADGSVLIQGDYATLANSLVYGSGGPASLLISNALVTTLQNNTLVGERSQVRLQGASSVSMENNILIADGEDHFVILNEGGAVNSDYNNLVARNGAWIGNVNGNWESLISWQQASGQDQNSFSHEPLFADEGNNDFHLRSVVGTYSNASYTVFTQHSPALDAGSPLSDFIEEPLPNGNRVNLGAYGGTAQASKSRLVGDKALLAMTGNDGGVLRGSSQILRWLSSNLTPSDTLSLEYSPDGGVSWSAIASGLPYNVNEYVWDTTSYQQSFNALWRVILDSDPSILDEIDQVVSLRTSSLDFFVNDTSQLDDVYTTAIGASGNDGLSSNTPKLTVQSILDTYDLEGGDHLYVDTGTYPLSAEVEWIWSDGGGAYGSNVVLQGAGWLNSEFDRGAASSNIHAFVLEGSYVTLRDIAVANAGNAVRVNSNAFNVIERSRFTSNLVGVLVHLSQSNSIQNNVFQNNIEAGVLIQTSTFTRVKNNTLIVPSGIGVRSDSGFGGVVENNIFTLQSTNALGVGGQTTDITMDYNVYDKLDAGPFALGYTNLIEWQLSYGHDFRSAITNAGYVDLAAGDVHLLSTQGRYDPASGNFVTVDVVNAWALDKGNPTDAFSLEPEENGGRVNLGAFGGTEFASKGSVSTQEMVQIRTLNKPFVIAETNGLQPLIWYALNLPSNLLVEVQFSGDGGVTWVTLSTQNVYDEYIVWEAMPYYNSLKALWRVIGETNGTTVAATNATMGKIQFGDFAILSVNNSPAGLRKVQWNGIWDEEYRVEFSNDGFVWTNAPTGVGMNQDAEFISTHGGDLYYEDSESDFLEFSNRLYRVIWRRPE